MTLILAAIPAWTFVFGYAYEFYLLNPSFDFVSSTYRPPSLVRDMFLVSLLSTLIGVVLLIVDFIQWSRKRSHDAIG
jgi:hypothetical protein